MQRGQISQYRLLQPSFTLIYILVFFSRHIFLAVCFLYPFLPHSLSPSILQVFDLHSGPKPVVFVLHSFLSAKLTRMGLLTWNNQQQQRGREGGPRYAEEWEDPPKRLILRVDFYFYIIISFLFFQFLHSQPKLGLGRRCKEDLTHESYCWLSQKCALSSNFSSASCNHFYCKVR